LGALHNVRMTVAAVTPESTPFGQEAKQAWAGYLARMAVFAGFVDVIYFVFFLAIGSPVLAWVNVISILIYGSIYVLVARRKLALAITLFWLEILPHAVLGTLMLGWDSGFYYLTLMFAPLVTLTNARLRALGQTLFVVLVLASLEVVLARQGPLTPIAGHYLLMLKWFHLLMLVGMLSGLASYYWGKITNAEKRLRKLAVVDALTGLHNRYHFQQVWDLELARLRRSAGQACVLMVDLDHFKAINDTHGHLVGDRVLVEVGRVLKQGVRDVDALARWGGEEFLLLMPDTSLDVALLVAERLRTGISACVLGDQAGEVRITASFGLTELRSDDSLSQAIARADQAMYRSKTQGRNRVSHE
jgi:diguanylate cyclase (GGDEF)-like protein